MAKRFGDTDIWKKQRWFRKLSPEYKLAFLYIKDQCDHAGIWNIDCTDLIEDLGIDSFNIKDFIEKCNIEYEKTTGEPTYKERVRLLDKGYLWVTGFIQFQYKGREGLVNPLVRAVQSSLQILLGFNLLDEALEKKYIKIPKGFDKGLITLKDKDKDKDNISLTTENRIKKNHNGKTGKYSGNFKAQGEELWVSRLAEGIAKANRDREGDNQEPT
jgi:hypothetical protein